MTFVYKVIYYKTTIQCQNGLELDRCLAYLIAKFNIKDLTLIKIEVKI